METSEVTPRLTILGSAKLTGYPYFWVKAVTGFLPSKHCAQCLKGWYWHSDQNRWRMDSTMSLAMGRAEFGYICGVTCRGWETNLHIPFRPKAGAIVTATLYNGQTLRLEHAEQLPIPPLPAGWGGLGRSFTTCRNFQFGVEYFSKAVRGIPIAQELGL